LEKVHELDPLAANISEQLARTSLVAGKPDRAKGVLERMDELTPRNPRILNGLAEYYMLMQDFAKAQELLTKGFEVNAREPLLRLNQGVLYALTGRKKDAEESMKEIMADKAESVHLYGQLFISAALGDLDQAFAALMRQADLHTWPFLIGSLPIFSELRKDPRYAQFAARMGLPH
jgi:Flp pilus assembly protein TadD